MKLPFNFQYKGSTTFHCTREQPLYPICNKIKSSFCFIIYTGPSYNNFCTTQIKRPKKALSPYFPPHFLHLLSYGIQHWNPSSTEINFPLPSFHQFNDSLTSDPHTAFSHPKCQMESSTGRMLFHLLRSSTTTCPLNQVLRKIHQNAYFQHNYFHLSPWKHFNGIIDKKEVITLISLHYLQITKQLYNDFQNKTLRILHKDNYFSPSPQNKITIQHSFRTKPFG